MPTETLHSVAVLGLGTMGHGIAQTFSAAGHTVSCFDESPAARASLHTRVQSNLLAAVESRIDLRDEIEPILSRLRICDREAKAVSDADFVTEAIKEDLGVKQELFKRLESCVGPETILASNSSTFPISQSGARMQTLRRSLVTHWFNPPHLVPLVEVVPGPGTEETVIQKTMAVLRALGKRPLLLRKELPGFLVNRIQVAIQREVWDLLERGVASAEEIDSALRASVGFRMAAVGPLEVHDFGGLDIQAAVFQNLAPQICSETKLSSIVQKLVDHGHLGAKTGKGFHDYSGQRLAERQARRDALYLALAKLLYPDSLKGSS